MNTNRWIKMLALLIAALMCTSALTACSLGNASKYRQALELTEQGDYEAAYALFNELGDYKDAAEEAAKFHYIPIKETAQLISPDGTRIENLVISLNENNLPYQCIKTGENGYQHTCLYSYTAGNQLMKITCSATDGTTENTTDVGIIDGNETVDMVGRDKMFRTTNVAQALFTDCRNKINITLGLNIGFIQATNQLQ